MVEIPTFFNKVDFIGKLLPGYLAVTLFIFLYRPDLVFNPDRALSFDLFSAVVFIVAGPTVGLTLQQLHRNVYTLVYSLSKKKKSKRAKTIELYAQIRLNLKEEEKMELDKAEAYCDFSVSTGLVFILLGIYYFVTKGIFESVIPFGLVLLSIVFFIGGFIERKETYSPIFRQLKVKYCK